MNDPAVPDYRCSVDGCGKPRFNVRGWCQMHYRRWNRYGDPLTTKYVRHGENRVVEGQKYRTSPEYTAWLAMRQRCYYPKAVSYPNYGGRGITVSGRWRYSFENFLTDMGRKPSPQHSLDRVDGDGPYSAENCRWATRSEQNQNQRHGGPPRDPDTGRFYTPH